MKKIEIEIRKVRGLSLIEKILINRYREREFGKRAIVDFRKEENRESKFFFIMVKNKGVAFGMLTPVEISYREKKNNILGFGSRVVIEKGKGYGRLLMDVWIAYTKNEGKTAIGFCGRYNFKRFEAYGMKTKKNFIRRFIYVIPKTKKEIMDSEGDIIYIEGKDKLVTKMFRTKSFAYCNKPYW